MNDLQDYAIRATDGDIGRVKDFYFDDELGGRCAIWWSKPVTG